MLVVRKDMIILSYLTFGAKANRIFLFYLVFGVTMDRIVYRINNPDKFLLSHNNRIKLYHPYRSYYFILLLSDNKK